jgi:hypothetical protein
MTLNLKNFMDNIYDYEPELYYNIKNLVFYPYKLRQPQSLDFKIIEEKYDIEIYWKLYGKTNFKIEDTCCHLCYLKTDVIIEDIFFDDHILDKDDHYELRANCQYCNWKLHLNFACQENVYCDYLRKTDIQKNKLNEMELNKIELNKIELETERINELYDWFMDEWHFEKIIWDIYCIIWQIIKKKYHLYKFMEHTIPDMKEQLTDLSIQKKKIYYRQEEKIFSFTPLNI